MRAPKEYGFWLAPALEDCPKHYKNFMHSVLYNKHTGIITKKEIQKELSKFGGFLYTIHKRRKNSFNHTSTIVSTVYYVGFKNSESKTAYLLRWS